MTKRVVLVPFLLLSFAFAAPKSIPRQPASTGILIGYVFGFQIQGDGISTTFTLTPSRVPQVYVFNRANYPNLPLVGVGGDGSCDNGAFTATVSSTKIVVNFPVPPPLNVFQNCSVVLLFQPE